MKIKILTDYDQSGVSFKDLQEKVNAYLAELPKGVVPKIEWIQTGTSFQPWDEPDRFARVEIVLTAIITTP